MIRKIYYLISVLLFTTLVSTDAYASSFDERFMNETIRFEFQLCGNADTTFVIEGDYYEEGFWSGSQFHLLNDMDYGNYHLELVNRSNNEVIYSSGFSPLFQEWKSTAEANQTMRGYDHVFRFPKPKGECLIRVKERQFNGEEKLLSEFTFSPKDYFIIKEQPIKYRKEIIYGDGKNVSHKVDVVMLADGYTEQEYDKFIKDARRMVTALFEMKPYDKYKNDFNFIAVFHPSLESGCDIPGEYQYKNTTYGSSFYTFDISRYLTARDMRQVYKDAGTVPYDQIYVLVNTKKYGGGGFYNSINLTSVDHPLSEEVFIHEFGHGFAGLADEYYNSSTAFDESYYNLKVEPWEPNITTLVQFDKKWKMMVSEKTPIPTPRTKKYKKTLGVFEGGGYMKKGVYSPKQDCRMKTNTSKGFCDVCQKSIARIIEHHR
ncbi:IgA Peptidase M64 [Halosquirtibacter xylanolyticus]|uniref:M64 family metallopeptidase n=1 Tax=Halosquirtibacter xylanolyticus TaxID=3374599 RepID=UPI003747861C|nr:IgA Peptidase M64 [Prolixibacteraceae bacterium]